MNLSKFQQVMHTLKTPIKEEEYSINTSAKKIYDEIDLKSNLLESDADGTEKTYICKGYGNNHLYLIERFVEDIAKGKKAFSTTVDKRGDMKNLELAIFFKIINGFLRSYSPSKIYSPHVDVFFNICIIKHGLMPGDFRKNPNTYSQLFKKKEGDFFNQIIEEIFETVSQRAFKRRLYACTEAINRGHSSSKNYLKALFDVYARLLVIRIDFGFRTSNPTKPHALGIKEAQDYFAQFLNNKRCKKIYTHLKGYIWRLEYGEEKGYHFHLFFFFDGSKLKKDEHLANRIGEDWISLTQGKGIYYNCNAHKQSYKRLGIGMISHDNEEMRRNLLDVLAYMYKEDQKLREKHVKKTHGWGRGAMPPEKKAGVGRPRRITASST